jgi:hypothetical protein
MHILEEDFNSDNRMKNINKSIFPVTFHFLPMAFFPFVFFGGVHVVYLLSFLCCVFCFVLFVFVLCLVSSVACVSGLSIFDCLDWTIIK